MPGDHVVIDMDPAESLNGAIALFDDTEASLLVNDHRNVYRGVKKPFIDVVIQHESNTCFVAVTSTPGYASAGDYAMVAANEFPTDLPEPRPDTVLLEFDGGRNVKVGSRTPVNVPAFDAGGISPVFAGQTNRMANQIVDRVREDYDGLDLTILSTAEGDTFEPGMTRIYFGTYDQALLGVAESIDEFNATTEQVAIIFTDTFGAFMKLDPSIEEMSQAIANVTSHEIGHLLGMVHTSDPMGIMDVTASLGDLLEDQMFTRAPMYTAVFPLGYQDAPRYLLDVLGGDLDFLAAKPLRVFRRDLGVKTDSARLSARAELHLSTCTLGDH